MSFVRASKIAILVDITTIDSDRLQIISEFIKRLKKLDKAIFNLAYTNELVVPEHLPFKCFCKKDLNWALVPKGDVVEGFLAREYDILINLNLEKSKPLEFINKVCKAHLCVGYYQPDQTPLFDLMLHNPEKNFQLFTQQIEKNLRQINN